MCFRKFQCRGRPQGCSRAQHFPNYVNSAISVAAPFLKCRTRRTNDKLSFKIVLQVLPEPSVTTRFPTTSRPAGDEPDWAGHLDSMVNAQERRGTCGHVFVLVLVLALALDFAFSFIPSETPRASHRILPFADGHRVARGKMASHSELMAPSPGQGLRGRTFTQ